MKFFIPLADDPQHGNLNPLERGPHRLLRAERPIDKTSRDLVPTHRQTRRCLGITRCLARQDRLRVPLAQKFLPIARECLCRPLGIGRQARPTLVGVLQAGMRRYDHRCIPWRVFARQCVQGQPAAHRIPDQNSLRPPRAHIICFSIQGFAKTSHRHRLARKKAPQVNRTRSDRIRRHCRRKLPPIARSANRSVQTPTLDGTRSANLIGLSGALNHAE